jgi:signal transduction histidine kinase
MLNNELMNESITADLFTALDMVIMEHLDDRCFGIIGNVPEWFVQFYPDATSERNKLRLGKKFPFLENFLVDAEDFWMENNAGPPLKSGLWSETDISGNECHLEASAVRLKNKKILLISLVEIAYKEKHSLIQKARETSLNYYNFFKEIQKKETLIHCIVHDLTGQLTGINYCFELLAFQNLTPKGREYLEKGRKQSKKQEMLIRDVLNAFAAEVESRETFILDPAQTPDLLTCAKEVVDALLLTFSLNNINLQIKPDIDISKDWKVVGEKLRLERVVSNLVENAFRHSPPYSTVTIDLEEDGEFILLSVDDEGSGVPQNISKNLFQKFFQGKEKSGRVGLGLYFCRITVENWGGSIGYSPRKPGGSRFWFRLPKPGLN